MAIKTRAELYLLFEDGDEPDELAFQDFLDSVYLKSEVLEFGTDTFFQKGGNAFAETAVLGTTDGYNLGFVTNNQRRFTVTSAGRVLFKTQTESTYDVDMNGVLRFGSHLATSVIRGDLDFDNASNAAYIKQGNQIARSIKIPGTGGNAPWIINNAGSNGLQVVDSTTPANVITLSPGSGQGLKIAVATYTTPASAMNITATAANNVNILLGSGEAIYGNNVGYNVKIQAGAGGAITNSQGGHVYLTPGAGGGAGVSGCVLVGGLRTFASNAAAAAALPLTALYYRTGHGLDVVV